MSSMLVRLFYGRHVNDREAATKKNSDILASARANARSSDNLFVKWKDQEQKNNKRDSFEELDLTLDPPPKQ